MHITKTHLLATLIGLSSVTMYSCKAKKAIVKTPPPIVRQEAPAEKAPEPAPKEEPAKPAPVEKPDYTFENVLFEFNSAVLKTASFQTLDKVTAEIKKDPSVSFTINGHSSAEGSPEHNMSLSVDRANAVKSYLVNAGFDAKNFTVNGFGEKQPASTNDDEEGRALNRRVEIKANR
jgi:outer membrane protein OmpA-like peptidoglycan-associated protein